MNYNAISGNASRLRRSPNSTGFAEIVSNYPPLLLLLPRLAPYETKGRAGEKKPTRP